MKNYSFSFKIKKVRIAETSEIQPKRNIFRRP